MSFFRDFDNFFKKFFDDPFSEGNLLTGRKKKRKGESKKALKEQKTKRRKKQRETKNADDERKKEDKRIGLFYPKWVEDSFLDFPKDFFDEEEFMEEKKEEEVMDDNGKHERFLQCKSFVSSGNGKFKESKEFIENSVSGMKKQIHEKSLGDKVFRLEKTVDENGKENLKTKLENINSAEEFEKLWKEEYLSKQKNSELAIEGKKDEKKKEGKKKEEKKEK